VPRGPQPEIWAFILIVFLEDEDARESVAGMCSAPPRHRMKSRILVGVCLISIVTGLGAAAPAKSGEGTGLLADGKAGTTFETLTVGERTFTGVTVWEQTAEMVYLKHKGGLVGIRVGELDLNTRILLGYEPVTGAEGSLRSGKWSGKDAFGGGAEAFGAALGRLSDSGTPFDPEFAAGFGLAVLGIIFLVGLIVHLLVSYLLRMICRKAGSTPGFLIWLPMFQVFPLLKAAGMSNAWPLGVIALSLAGALSAGTSIELGLLISLSSSLLALGIWIAWSIRICLARGKHPAWAVLLLLPGFNFLGLIYLAASE
jgi:hypothetical protein